MSNFHYTDFSGWFPFNYSTLDPATDPSQYNLKGPKERVSRWWWGIKAMRMQISASLNRDLIFTPSDGSSPIEYSFAGSGLSYDQTLSVLPTGSILTSSSAVHYRMLPINFGALKRYPNFDTIGRTGDPVMNVTYTSSDDPGAGGDISFRPSFMMDLLAGVIQGPDGDFYPSFLLKGVGTGSLDSFPAPGLADFYFTTATSSPPPAVGSGGGVPWGVVGHCSVEGLTPINLYGSIGGYVAPIDPDPSGSWSGSDTPTIDVTLTPIYTT